MVLSLKFAECAHIASAAEPSAPITDPVISPTTDPVKPPIVF